MNLLLFFIILSASFTIVRIGAVAFHITGVDWPTAKFQSLSCFSGTGFTTREAEIITATPQRRKIASILMVSGNVGLVTLIATFANSLRPAAALSLFNIPFLKKAVPSSLFPAANLLLIIIFSYAFFKIFTNRKIATRVNLFLRKHIRGRKIIKQPSFISLAEIDKNHGIAQSIVGTNSTAAGRTVEDVESGGIRILAVKNKSGYTYSPLSSTRVNSGDRLICLGDLEVIEEYFA